MRALDAEVDGQPAHATRAGARGGRTLRAPPRGAGRPRRSRRVRRQRFHAVSTHERRPPAAFRTRTRRGRHGRRSHRARRRAHARGEAARRDADVGVAGAADACCRGAQDSSSCCSPTGAPTPAAVPPDVAAALAAELGVRVHTVGIGGEGEVAMATRAGGRSLGTERHDLDARDARRDREPERRALLRARRARATSPRCIEAIDRLERVERPGRTPPAGSPEPEPRSRRRARCSRSRSSWPACSSGGSRDGVAHPLGPGSDVARRAGASSRSSRLWRSGARGGPCAGSAPARSARAARATPRSSAPCSRSCSPARAALRHAHSWRCPADGIDVVVLLDVSRSMDATDTPPSRLVRARAAARDLLLALGPGDRAALAVYAGHGALLTPLTSDAAALVEMLPALDSELMSDRGSRFARGRRRGARRLRAREPAPARGARVRRRRARPSDRRGGAHGRGERAGSASSPARSGARRAPCSRARAGRSATRPGRP